MKRFSSLSAIYFSSSVLSFIFFIIIVQFASNISEYYPSYSVQWLYLIYIALLPIFIEFIILVSVLIYLKKYSSFYGSVKHRKYSMIFISSFCFFMSLYLLLIMDSFQLLFRSWFNLSNLSGYVVIASTIAVFVIPMTYLVMLYGGRVFWSSIVFVATESFTLGQYLILSSGNYQDFPWYNHQYCNLCFSNGGIHMMLIFRRPPAFLIVWQYVIESLIFVEIAVYLFMVYRSLVGNRGD